MTICAIFFARTERFGQLAIRPPWAQERIVRKRNVTALPVIDFGAKKPSHWPEDHSIVGATGWEAA
jgi:hypothetical protein